LWIKVSGLGLDSVGKVLGLILQLVFQRSKMVPQAGPKVIFLGQVFFGTKQWFWGPKSIFTLNFQILYFLIFGMKFD